MHIFIENLADWDLSMCCVDVVRKLPFYILYVLLLNFGHLKVQIMDHNPGMVAREYRSYVVVYTVIPFFYSTYH